MGVKIQAYFFGDFPPEENKSKRIKAQIHGSRVPLINKAHHKYHLRKFCAPKPTENLVGCKLLEP